MPGHDAIIVLDVREALLMLTLVLATGWVAESIIDSGMRGWHAPVLCGLAGLYVGPPLLAVLGWRGGPSLWGHLLVPIVVGALVACAVLKVLNLVLAGSRR